MQSFKSKCTWTILNCEQYLPVVLGSSRRTGGAESRDESPKIGSVSPPQDPPSSHFLASGPSFRIKLCSSASFSIKAFRNLQFVVLTSRSLCSNSHTEESRPFLHIGFSVARILLSTFPEGFLFSSISWNRDTLVCSDSSWMLRFECTKHPGRSKRCRILNELRLYFKMQLIDWCNKGFKTCRWCHCLLIWS